MSQHFQTLQPESLGWAAIIIRIVLALLFGGLIGTERELTNHPAGIKTHALVCIGSALSSLITVEMAYEIHALNQITSFAPSIDISRIAAGVVTGIGFIGAGAILKSKSGSIVTGITTAATIWVTGCLGLAVGMGYYKMSIVTFLTVFIATPILNLIEKNFLYVNRQYGYEITMSDRENTLKSIRNYCESKSIQIKSTEYMGKTEGFLSDGRDVYRYRFSFKAPKNADFSSVVNDLSINENILQIFETSFDGKKKSSGE